MNTNINYPAVTNNRYRLNYHIMAPYGWINDPNGFCYYKGYYHIFYQYHPESPEWGPMHWGHARSQDLVHWEHLPIALYPGDAEDPDGCFSGSAIEKDGRLYLVYTGQHLSNKNPECYWETQNLAVSDDGIHFDKCPENPVISKPPTDNAADFRDPKIWFDDDQWFMVVGSKNTDGLGRALLYRSENLLEWTYMGPLSTAKSVDNEGFVWECPDFFKLSGKDILMISPQGIKANGLDYQNLFQSGYFIGKFDKESNKFVHDSFKELDHGHDFYAPQTMLAPDGRRILLGWMGMWESEMPEQQDGWAGTLTFPRELTFKNNKLLMTPVREIIQLREKLLLNEHRLGQKHNFWAKTKSLEYIGVFDNKTDVRINILNEKNQLLVALNYQYSSQIVSLQKYNDEKLRKVKIELLESIDVHMLIDSSSIEIFVNNGEACFSERIYEESNLKIETISYSNDSQLKIYQLGGAMVCY